MSQQMSSGETPSAPLPAPKPPWARLISNYDRGYISFTELLTQLFDHVQVKAPDDYAAVTLALRSHPEEFIRTTFSKNFVEMVETARKVIDYAVEVLPLEERIGCRVHIGGGYTAVYEPDQPWLAGRKRHEGRLFGDVKIGDRRFPLALVRLDYVLELPARQYSADGPPAPPLRGRFLLLYPRYQNHSWSNSEDIVFAYLMDAPPRDSAWWSSRDHYEIESHATYWFLDD